jgi:hypothetical protein
MAIRDEITEIKLDSSPPMMGLPGPVSTSFRMKRNPSLTKVSTWNGSMTREQTEVEEQDDVEEHKKGNRTPLLQEEIGRFKHLLQDYSWFEVVVIYFNKYEKDGVNLLVMLLFHLSLISIFESIFFFFYVSSLEDNGIGNTIHTFVDGAVQLCSNMTALDIQLINDFVDPFVNVTQIVIEGDSSQVARSQFNAGIMERSWEYAGGLAGMFLCLLCYVVFRKIEIKWGKILLENTLMVSLLGAYEVLFFNKIIYHYQPLTTEEIRRDAVEKLSKMCGLFQ